MQISSMMTSAAWANPRAAFKPVMASRPAGFEAKTPEATATPTPKIPDAVADTQARESVQSRSGGTLWERFQRAYDSVEGDARFDARLDFDRNGEIGANDYSQLAAVVGLNRPQATWEEIQAAYDTVEGDENYNPNADLNKDGEVGAADFSLYAADVDTWNHAVRRMTEQWDAESVASTGMEADLNQDGEVGAADYSVLANIIGLSKEWGLGLPNIPR